MRKLPSFQKSIDGDIVSYMLYQYFPLDEYSNVNQGNFTSIFASNLTYVWTIILY